MTYSQIADTLEITISGDSIEIPDEWKRIGAGIIASMLERGASPDAALSAAAVTVRALIERGETPAAGALH